jgi:hypothetical protein
LTSNGALRVGLAAAFAGIVGLHALSATTGSAAQAAAPARAAAARPGAGDGGFTMALTGDSLITMKLSVHTDPAFVKMVDLIRGADAAFTNLEMLLHDYEPYPSTQSGGTWPKRGWCRPVSAKACAKRVRRSISRPTRAASR